LVTAAAILWTLGAGQAEARAKPSVANWFDGMFGDGKRKSRRGAAKRPSAPATTSAAVIASVPLPRPRPAEAPTAASAKPAQEQAAPAPDHKPAEQAAQQPPESPPPTACRLALTEEIAVAPSVPAIHGPGGCGGDDLVRLEAVVLPDKHRVALTPAAILRCPMASAIADWVRTDLAPLADKLGGELTTLDNFDSFECRGRNRVPGAQLSEHGRANALDVRAFKYGKGQQVALTDRNVAREVRETVLHNVCARFMTVLGPGSDGYHEDHIHLDLMERRNNYKICQWNVWDPLPQVAPLLPAPRPEEAPQREVAGKPDAGEPANGKSGDGKSEEGDAAKPDSQEPDAATTSATSSSKPDKPQQTKSAKRKRER
jgi:hypothetical protein